MTDKVAKIIASETSPVPCLKTLWGSSQMTSRSGGMGIEQAATVYKIWIIFGLFCATRKRGGSKTSKNSPYAVLRFFLERRGSNVISIRKSNIKVSFKKLKNYSLSFDSKF